MEDVYGDQNAQAGADVNGYLKRKRSNSPERSAIPTKIVKTLAGGNIDFLASVPTEALPLVDTDDSLRFIQQHFEQYSGVVERHESLAANLGAKLQAPNSIKRFERLFMHPIKIITNHGREGNTVTWVDIVKFYEEKPGLFKLQQKDGERVCQFYTKQCRVEITADEFEFIQSGQPQRMLPSSTVPADEEKELGTIEFMETRIGLIVRLADQVAGRGKQLITRLKQRRNALAAKREIEVNGGAAGVEGAASEQRAGSPVAGFTAVNSGSTTNGGITTLSSFSKPLVSAAVKQELTAVFMANRDRSLSGSSEYPIRSSKSRNRASEYGYAAEAPFGSASPAQPTTPGFGAAAAATPTSRPAPAEKVDNDGPFKAEMLSRMEKMSRFTIVRPPCDRCRRLNIECQKNLTACLGCTRKHAKCSWKEVTKQELVDNPPPQATGPVEPGRRGSMSGSDEMQAGARSPVPVLDKELLGEDSDDEDADHLPAAHDIAGQPVAADVQQNGVPSGQLSTALTQQSANATSSASATLSSPRAEPAPMVATMQDGDASALTHNGNATSAVHAPNDQREQAIKAEPAPFNGQRLPGFPQILGDRMMDNPTILGAATGERLAREAQGEIERLQPDAAAHQHQNTVTKV